MNNSKDFLLELGCEELPSSALLKLSNALTRLFKEELNKAELPHQNIQTFATPRRLAILIPDLIDMQPPSKIERLGPSVDKAFDSSGTPTLACMGFAKSCNVTVDQLERKVTDKGERVCCVIEQPGINTADLLPELVGHVIKKLPIPKPMRWGNKSVTFIRPVHWVIMLFGEELIDAEILGIKTTRDTFGHRFHHPEAISIPSPKEYNQILYTQGKVVADFTTRRNLIQKQIEQALESNQHAIMDESLLDEVTSLVEWPVVLKGKFDQDFLGVPKEALIMSMQSHQKCFALENDTGDLLSQFLLVSNIESKEPETVIKGNERVIRARLSDAAFFYNQDKKHTLESHLPRLDNIVFQQKLGSIGDKAKRVSQLATHIAKQMDADTALAKRAGQLCKCDLVSEMVCEFPSLQGIMGHYYALNDNEPKECAQALQEHYLPRFSGDQLPATTTGGIIALADRLDTLVGILGVNLIPTGEKDPFALRRAAQGIFRLLIEKNIPLNLVKLLDKAKSLFKTPLPNQEVTQQAFDFIMHRLKFWYLEQNVIPEVFEAVLACSPTEPLDFHHRVQAVRQFQELPEASALAAANKRVSNILKKTQDSIPNKTNASLLEPGAEKTLAELLDKHRDEVLTLYSDANYTQALSQLSSLKQPVDSFFDEVMVMVDDDKLRKNRLALLASLRHLFTQVADIALLP